MRDGTIYDKTYNKGRKAKTHVCQPPYKPHRTHEKYLPLSKEFEQHM